MCAKFAKKKIPDDRRHLSETCLYMVHFSLKPFFPKSLKKYLHRSIKSKPKGKWFI